VRDAELEGQPVEGPTAVVGLDDVGANERAAHFVDEQADDAERVLGEVEERAAIERAIEALPARERHIVRSHYLEGVRFKEIGAQLGVSEPRVSQLHARALTLLAKQLASPAAA
jgi:RNA polymerase sigma factor for flagellar operon FliA